MSKTVYDTGRLIIFKSFEEGGARELVDYLKDTVNDYDSASWEMMDEDFDALYDSINDGDKTSFVFITMDMLIDNWGIKTGVVTMDNIERVVLYKDYSSCCVSDIPTTFGDLTLVDGRIEMNFSTSYYNGGAYIDEVISKGLDEI